MLKRVLPVLLITLVPLTALSHDEADHAHENLKYCVDFSFERKDRDGGSDRDDVYFNITNNCDYGAHVSWCWERPDSSYKCMDTEAALANLTHPWGLLKPGRSLRHSDYIPKRAFRYWWNACIARDNSSEEVDHADDHCGLRESGGTKVLQGWGQYQIQVVP